MAYKRYQVLSWILFTLFTAFSIGAQEAIMLKTYLDGREVSLEPASRLDNGDVLVPLEAFCSLVGA